MWNAIFRFEVRYHLRQPLIYLITLLFGLMIFLAVTTDGVQIGGSIGKVHRNAPLVIMQLLTIMSVIGLFVVTAFVASSAQRDFERRTHELFFSKPIRRFDYLTARFAGSMVISLLIYVVGALTIAAGSLMPWLDPERVGPFQPEAYLFTLLVMVLPNLFFMGATFYALAVRTRSMMATYLGVVVFFVGFSISRVMLSDVENETVANLLDPFGLSALRSATKYWTIVESNTSIPELAGPLLYNRLLWIGAGLLFLALGYATFNPSRAERRRKRRGRLAAEAPPAALQAGVVLPRANRVFSRAATLRQYLAQTRLEAFAVFKSVPFIVILAMGIFNVIGGAIFMDRTLGTDVYPVTHLMLQAIRQSYAFLLVIIITFYSGDVIWKERTLKLSAVYDAAPTPSGVYLAAKLSALVAATVAFLLGGFLATIGVQVANGYYHLEPALYAKGFGLIVLPFVLIAILACFFQVIARSKFVGYALMIVFLLSSDLLDALDLRHNLYRFAETPPTPYSDMNGYGHFLTAYFWFILYWAFFSAVLLGLTIVFWNRGTESAWKTRWALARARFRGPARALVAAGAVGFVATGAWIYYNTNVVNEYVPDDKAETRQAEYEKKYRQYKDVLLPRIKAVRAEVDIFPEERRVEIRGTYRVRNEGDVPIRDIHFNLSNRVRVNALDFPPHQVNVADDELGYYVYALDEPLVPGATAELGFDLTVEHHGFVNHGSDTTIVENGTFFNNQAFFPILGYAEGRQLVDRNTRRKHGLEPVLRFAKIDDDFARRNTYLGPDADWVDFETTVSTSADQIAIAPGYLDKEWTVGDRRYFHYKMDVPILHFFSYLSARYAVARDRWGDVAIEVYHHPGHEYNVARMIDSVKKSLDYYTTNFSPYQHRQVRIVEFPRYAQFAQSFPNTIPFSESIGFIAKVDDDEDIDYPFYVTAHEVAHQWWAHQVIGGYVQGATMLSETMAQYSALMVMEKEYGPEKMRRFLKYELDNYLRNRGGELVEEMPLYLVENQPYIHYRKGSVVMYALKDYLGEKPLNRALADYVAKVAFQKPPFTTTLEFLDYIREAVPPGSESLIQDLFKTITLFENKVDDATYAEQPDGTYLVRLEAEAKKVRADGDGVETEIPIDDWIDVAVFGEKDGDSGAEGKVLFLEKRHVTEPRVAFEVVVGERPVRAGIDPYNKLVDRNSDDNVKRVSEASAEEVKSASVGG